MLTMVQECTIFVTIISVFFFLTDIKVVKVGVSLRSPLLKLFQLQKDTQLVAQGYKVFRAWVRMFHVTLVLSAQNSPKSTLARLASIGAGSAFFSPTKTRMKNKLSPALFLQSTAEHRLLPIAKALSTLKLWKKKNLDPRARKATSRMPESLVRLTAGDASG